MTTAMPNIKTVYPEPVNGINFAVMAFRTLTKEEMRISIAYYFRSVKKKARKGDTITILSVLQ